MCMQFQDLGHPRVHACSAALKADVDVLGLCIEERRVGSLQMVYARGIIPVDLDTVPVEDALPPIVQRLPGRPKTKRIRRAHEDRPSTIHFCSLCGERGHTRKTCPENFA